MSDFANLADGGRRLAALLADAIVDQVDVVLCPAIPNGVPVVSGMLETLTLPVVPLPVERSDEGARILPIEGVRGRTVVVVDDGVETGTVARAAVAPLRESGAARLILAVPVCPREAMADLQHGYDVIVSVVRPMMRRDLAWHYADFDTIDEPAARRLLESMPSE